MSQSVNILFLEIHPSKRLHLKSGEEIIYYIFVAPIFMWPTVDKGGGSVAVSVGVSACDRLQVTH